MTARRRLKILYADNHLLVVDKPAGLPTIGVGADEMSLVKLAKAHLKRECGKPGNVYLGVMSRLDAAVSGVVVLARTSKAAARLTKQFAAHEVTKIYWALVSGRVAPPAGSCVDWIGKDERLGRVVTMPPGDAAGREARLEYRLLENRPLMGAGRAPHERRLPESRSAPASHCAAVSLLEVKLLTGRKHQIRVQLAARGWPILGDRKYGSRQPWAEGIALHARRLALEHPVGRAPLEFEAPLPAAWSGWAPGRQRAGED